MPDDVRAIELYRLRMPMAEPFRTALDTTTQRDAMLVRVATAHGEGWGEVGAQIRPSYAPDTLDTARLLIRDELAPRVFAGAGIGHEVRGHHAARAALECALLDAQLRAEGVSLAAHLGADKTHVDAGIAVGMHPEPSGLVEAVERYVAQGYRSIKLKIAPGRALRFVEATRAAVGAGTTLHVDANGTYALEQADELRALDDFDLATVEQPLAPDALLDHAQLATRLRTPICLDETITSARVVRDALALAACRVVSIKAALVGGLAEAVRGHHSCVEAGFPARAGGMLETGVGRAALVALAALPGFTVPGDLSASDRYFAEDITEPFELEDGRLPVPDGPGLGVTPRPDALARFTVARERLVPRA